MKIVILISTLFLFNINCFAATNSVKTSFKKADQSSREVEKISLSFSSDIETDFKKTNSSDKAYTLSQAITASKGLGFGTVSATLPWSFSAQTNREKSDLGNASLSLVLKDYLIEPLVIAYFPTSQFSKDETSYNGAIKVAALKTLSSNLLNRGISTSASLSLKKNLYKFKIDRYGGSNSSWQSTIGLSMGYKLTSKLSVGHSISYLSSLNFNERVSNSFVNSHSLNYSVNKRFSARLGIVNGDSLLNKRGSLSAPSIFNKNTSSIYAGLSITN